MPLTNISPIQDDLNKLQSQINKLKKDAENKSIDHDKYVARHIRLENFVKDIIKHQNTSNGEIYFMLKAWEESIE